MVHLMKLIAYFHNFHTAKPCAPTPKKVTGGGKENGSLLESLLH